MENHIHVFGIDNAIAQIDSMSNKSDVFQMNP